MRPGSTPLAGLRRAERRALVALGLCTAALALALAHGALARHRSLEVARELIAAHALQSLVTAPSGHRERHPELGLSAVDLRYTPGELEP